MRYRFGDPTVVYRKKSCQAFTPATAASTAILHICHQDSFGWHYRDAETETSPYTAESNRERSLLIYFQKPKGFENQTPLAKVCSSKNTIKLQFPRKLKSVAMIHDPWSRQGVVIKRTYASHIQSPGYSSCPLNKANPTKAHQPPAPTQIHTENTLLRYHRASTFSSTWPQRFQIKSYDSGDLKIKSPPTPTTEARQGGAKGTHKVRTISQSPDS